MANTFKLIRLLSVMQIQEDGQIWHHSRQPALSLCLCVHTHTLYSLCLYLERSVRHRPTPSGTDLLFIIHTAPFPHFFLLSFSHMVTLLNSQESAVEMRDFDIMV